MRSELLFCVATKVAEMLLILEKKDNIEDDFCFLLVLPACCICSRKGFKIGVRSQVITSSQPNCLQSCWLLFCIRVIGSSVKVLLEVANAHISEAEHTFLHSAAEDLRLLM